MWLASLRSYSFRQKKKKNIVTASAVWKKPVDWRISWLIQLTSLQQGFAQKANEKSAFVEGSMDPHMQTVCWLYLYTCTGIVIASTAGDLEVET